MSETFTIGIIGGGQLSLMLGQSLEKFQNYSQKQVALRFFIKSKTEPAFLGLSSRFPQNHFYFSDSFSSGEFKKFAQDCDRLTLESEFFCPTEKDFKSIGLDPDLLCPSLSSLGILTNKFLQKKAALKLGIPTPDFFDIQNPAGTHSDPNQEWVLKWATGGYDGLGTFFLKSLNELKNPTSVLKTFLGDKTSPSLKLIFAEKKINLKAELAMSCVRMKSQPDNFYFFPLVNTEQKNGVCAWAECPVPADLGLPGDCEKTIQGWMKKLCLELNYFGLLTVELFLDSSGKLWVNEWAPRVHNSLHLSREAFGLDQFSAHLCALLPATQKIKHDLFILEASTRVLMKNILGRENRKLTSDGLKAGPSPVLKSQNGIQISIQGYGKTESRPGRKLGHLCAKSNLSTPREPLRKILIEEEEKILK